MKVTGSVLAVLAIVALLAAAALADESEWELGGETLTELSLEEEEIAVEDKPVNIAIPSLEVKVECKKTKGGGAILKGGSTELALELTSCEIPGAPACEVTEPLVLETRAELTYAGGVYYDEFGVAKEKSSLGTLAWGGGECGSPKEGKLSGSFAAELPLEESEKLPEKFSEAITTTVNKALKEEEPELKLSFSESPAYMEGAFVLVPPLPPGVVTRIPLTKLCPGNAHFCTAPFEAQTAVDTANVGEAFFVFGEEPVICETSGFRAVTEETSGAPIRAVILEFPTQECGECTIEPTGDAEFVTTGGPGNGRMTLINLKIESTCGEEFCVYARDSMRFTMTGGMPAMLKAAPGVSFEKKPGSDEGCIASIEWEGPMGNGMTYKVTSPNQLYVTG